MSSTDKTSKGQMIILGHSTHTADLEYGVRGVVSYWEATAVPSIACALSSVFNKSSRHQDATNMLGLLGSDPLFIIAQSLLHTPHSSSRGFLIVGDIVGSFVEASRGRVGRRILQMIVTGQDTRGISILW